MRTTKTFRLQVMTPLLFLVMVLCMGCPYDSKFPLDGTKVRYNSNLIGTWHEGETDLKITRIDDYKFAYVYDDHDDEEGAGKETGTGYAVTNNGATYLVAERTSSGDKTYAIYKVLSVESQGLNVIPLDEDDIPSSKSFSSSSDFTNYVLNYAGSAFAYSNKQEYVKGISSYTGYSSNSNTNTNNSNNNSNRGLEPQSSKTSYSSDVLFKEDYQTYDNNWYSNYNFKDSNYIYIATLDNPDNHYYLFRNRKYKGGYFVPIPYNSIPNAYYSVTVNARHFDGVDDSGYGIKFGASDWDNCYNLDITNNGYYRLSKHDKGTYSNLVEWTKSSSLNQGTSSNKLEVRVYYTYVDIYINDQYITRANNFNRFGNNAGLEVYNNQTVYFDDLVIKKL